MKKVFSILAVAAMTSFVACGPSAEEKAKLEEDAKRLQDSISASITESMQNEAAVEDTANTAVPATTSTDTTTAAPAAEGHEGHNH